MTDKQFLLIIVNFIITKLMLQLGFRLMSCYYSQLHILQCHHRDFRADLDSASGYRYSRFVRHCLYHYDDANDDVHLIDQGQALESVE